MDARRAVLAIHEVVNMKPFVVLAAKFMPPGRLRLEMVKLAHELDYGTDTQASDPRAA